MEATAAAPVPQETIITLISLSSADQNRHGAYTPEQFLAQHAHLGFKPLADAGLEPRDAAKLPILTCVVDLCPGVQVKAWAVGQYVFISSVTQNRESPSIHEWGRKVEAVAPFIRVEADGPAYNKTVEREIRTGMHWNQHIEKRQVLDTYGEQHSYQSGREVMVAPGIPWNYVNLKVTIHAAALVANPPAPYVTQAGFVKCQRPDGGTLDIDSYGPASTVFRCTTDFYGLPLAWDESLNDESGRSYDYRWVKAHRLFGKGFTVKQGQDALWQRFLGMFEDRSKLNKGVKSTMTRKGIRENVERLKTEEPLLWSYVAWLHDDKTRAGISNNTLLAAFLEARGTDFTTLKAAIRESMAFALTTTASVHYGGSGSIPQCRDICLGLPGAKDKDEEKRSKREWYLRKSNKEQAEGLGISATGHPKLMAAVESGEIPLGIFHKTGQQLHLINVEFDLWEMALTRPGWSEPLCKIAQDASRRTTYDKVVTSYIAFLFRIERYLDRHTGKGKKWKAFPKFIESEYELEMNEAEEGGTTKRRSAMTPIPDNDARTITVPYVAMAIRGVRTTYCYSLDYQVFEEMTIDRESGTPIVNELERRLNGRDDYGLMYYTLTGTPQNTGYPAFLIIFERRRENTHVHFHRVHPSRSKGGIPTPASRLIEECYRYMAGNVRAEEIYAQQGDLIFIKTEQTVPMGPEAKPVKEFESHAFKPMEGKPILLIPNEAKSIKNRLGFIYSEGIFMVDHPEHEPIKGIPAGMYEVRRCKSWEANPKAVWVLTID